MMIKEALSVLGLFSKKDDLDLELLPPPPPFPDIEPERKNQKESKKRIEKTKIILKHKDNTQDVLERSLQKNPKEPEDFLSMDTPKMENVEENIAWDDSEIKDAITKAKEQKQEKIGFWKKLFTKKETSLIQESQELDIANMTMKNTIQINAINPKEVLKTPTVEVMDHIKTARIHLEALNINKAKEEYVEMMKLYRMMTPKEQEGVYELIQEIYEERKAAEKMPRK